MREQRERRRKKEEEGRSETSMPVWNIDKKESNPAQGTTDKINYLKYWSIEKSEKSLRQTFMIQIKSKLLVSLTKVCKGSPL